MWANDESPPPLLQQVHMSASATRRDHAEQQPRPEVSCCHGAPPLARLQVSAPGRRGAAAADTSWAATATVEGEEGDGMRILVRSETPTQRGA
jgi:hypothetical protein